MESGLAGDDGLDLPPLGVMDILEPQPTVLDMMPEHPPLLGGKGNDEGGVLVGEGDITCMAQEQFPLSQPLLPFPD